MCVAPALNVIIQWVHAALFVLNVDVLDVRGETSVHAEESSVVGGEDGGEGKLVEAEHETVVHGETVLLLALPLEAEIPVRGRGGRREYDQADITAQFHSHIWHSHISTVEYIQADITARCTDTSTTEAPAQSPAI